MKRLFATFLLIGFSMATAATALACGEGIFSMGEGLRYQGYLAPRPATILVYADEGPHGDEQIAVYRGLVQAGHRLAVAHDREQLSNIMQQHQFDVVIADLDAAAAVSEVTSASEEGPRLLPVVQRSQRNQPGLRSQFDLFVLDGASLGQYLKQINRLMRD